MVIFMPIDLCMFYFLPIHLRTPFLALAGLAWPITLSLRRGGGVQQQQQQQQQMVVDEAPSTQSREGGIAAVVERETSRRLPLMAKATADDLLGTKAVAATAAAAVLVEAAAAAKDGICGNASLHSASPHRLLLAGASLPAPRLRPRPLSPAAQRLEGLPSTLTDNGARLISSACAEAARRGHTRVATEHVLHALFATDAGRGTGVAQVLEAEAGVDVAALLAVLDNQPEFEFAAKKKKSTCELQSGISSSAASAQAVVAPVVVTQMSEGLKQSLALAEEVDAATGASFGVTTEYVEMQKHGRSRETRNAWARCSCNNTNVRTRVRVHVLSRTPSSSNKVFLSPPHACMPSSHLCSRSPPLCLLCNPPPP
jgi:hypothetical protein